MNAKIETYALPEPKFLDRPHNRTESDCRLCQAPVYHKLGSELCYHCDMFRNGNKAPDDARPSIIDQLNYEYYLAAQWLIRQLFVCPCCHLEIKMMRFVSPIDGRITAEQNDRMMDLYYRSLDVARMPPYGTIRGPNRNIIYASSVWFQCWCPELKLINDLVGTGTDWFDMSAEVEVCKNE